jgi:hydrogenase maturation protease
VSLLAEEPRGERAATLVIGVGNPARGDDGLGPRLLGRLRGLLAVAAANSAAEIELMQVYQLQPEHALDLRGRRRVIVIDAAADLQRPFDDARVRPAALPSLSTHSLTPESLAAMYQRLYGSTPPMRLLAVRGSRFGLGDGLSADAAVCAEAALARLCRILGLVPGP